MIVRAGKSKIFRAGQQGTVDVAGVSLEEEFLLPPGASVFSLKAFQGWDEAHSCLTKIWGPSPGQTDM